MNKIVPWVLAGCLALGGSSKAELTEDQRLDYMNYNYKIVLGEFLGQFHSDIEDGFLSIDEQKSLFLRVNEYVPTTRDYRKIHPKSSPEYEHGKYDMQNMFSRKVEKLYDLINENLNGSDLGMTSLERYLRNDFVNVKVESHTSEKEIGLGLYALFLGGLFGFALRYDPKPAKEL
jgi:hypothetical protein